MRKKIAKLTVIFLFLLTLLCITSCAKPAEREEAVSEEATTAEEAVAEEAVEEFVPMLETLSPAQIAKSVDHAAVLAELRTGRPVRLILRLDTPGYTPISSLPEDETRKVLEAIGNAQDDFAAALYRPLQAEMLPFHLVPYISVWVQDTTEYASVLGSDPVLTARQDLPVPVNTLENIENFTASPLAEIDDWIGLSAAHALGYDGSGWTIAILDTGVDKDHAFLDEGKVIEEACFSTTDQNIGSLSLCPEGAPYSTAADAAEPYASGLCPDHSCDHGTHVAAIAAGQDDAFSGAAPGASLLAVQVFSAFQESQYCEGAQSCALSWISDQVRALEYVYERSREIPIAAVNLSLGLGRNREACEDDVRTEIIDTLTAAGIAVVISTGNDGYTDGIHAPACIPSAVAVSATINLENNIPDFSNAAPGLVDVWAPGSSITSALPTERFGAGAPTEAWHGTSMAAPIVSGAWALFKQVDPAANVAYVLAEINYHGIPLQDQRPNGETTAPRINLSGVFLEPCVVPTSSSFIVNQSKATLFQWFPVADTAAYEIKLYGPHHNPVTSWQIDGRDCQGSAICTEKNLFPLEYGAYQWRVRAINHNNHAVGAWSPLHLVIFPSQEDLH